MSKELYLVQLERYVRVMASSERDAVAVAEGRFHGTVMSSPVDTTGEETEAPPNPAHVNAYMELFRKQSVILSQIEEFCTTTLQDWPSARGNGTNRSDLEMVLDCINREGEWKSTT